MDSNTQNEINKARARQVVNASAFGKTNNAYPGQNMGLSLEQVKRLVDEAKKIQGTTFISAIGSVTAFSQQTGKPQLGYYEFVRPVASATAINLNYTSAVAANVILFSVWYV